MQRFTKKYLKGVAKITVRQTATYKGICTVAKQEAAIRPPEIIRKEGRVRNASEN